MSLIEKFIFDDEQTVIVEMPICKYLEEIVSPPSIWEKEEANAFLSLMDD